MKEGLVAVLVWMFDINRDIKNQFQKGLYILNGVLELHLQ
jgi:hypothetical protein